MEKKKIRVLKKYSQSAAEEEQTVAAESKATARVQKDIGKVVGDWIDQRRENRRTEKDDSEKTIRDWKLEPG